MGFPGKNLLGAGFGLMSLTAFAAGATPHYYVTDLGTFGGDLSSAKAINDSGQVTGQARVSSGADHAFLYTNGTMMDLGAMPGAGATVGNGINAAGKIAGEAGTDGTLRTAYLHSGGSNGSYQSLSTLGGASALAMSVNDSDVVTGSSDITGNSVKHAFRYSNGVMTDLGALYNGRSEAFAINNAGQVVGESTIIAQIQAHAFLHDGSTMSDLGTLGGRYSSAHAINASGQVAGVAENSSLRNRAFLYTVPGGMQDLGTPTGFNLTEAWGINDAGDVVGTGQPPNANSRALLYRDGTWLDLNDAMIPIPGHTWTLSIAYDINNVGQIVGGGLIDGKSHGFLLTPTEIPEPGCAVLGGWIALAVLRRTRRRPLV
jgi:probable HAF family extracellular repeat protein